MIPLINLIAIAVVGGLGTLALYFGQADARYPAPKLLWKIMATVTVLVVLYGIFGAA